MNMAHVIESYGEALVKKYHHRLLPSHRRALNAMLARRKSCGDVQAASPVQCIRYFHSLAAIEAVLTARKVTPLHG
jgi:hypothetical protein